MRLSLLSKKTAASAILASILAASTAFAGKPGVELRWLDSYDHGSYLAGASEIVAHDPLSQRLFVVNAEDSSIDVLDASDPSDLSFLFAIDVSTGSDFQANSVDVCNGVVAAAIQNEVKTSPGTVKFYDTDGNLLKSLVAGALPDMVTFTPNCERVLVANEGEPNSYGQADSIDPEGSITVVDLRNGVGNATATQVGFTQFNDVGVHPQIRIFGPNASVAQDLEPEYIAVDHNSKTAWITLQENNALAILDIKSATITDIVPLGYKDHRLPENGFDAGDRDGAGNTARANIANWPVFGMYQPDAIAAFKIKNETFLITANEGDAREYTGLVEEVRVGSGSYPLNAAIFPNAAALKTNAQLARLTVTNKTGNTNGGTDFEEIYVFGGRSFSIHKGDGTRIFDSGSQIEEITFGRYPSNYNANHSCDPCLPLMGGASGNEPDNRSDNKGPEPESVTVGKAYGRTYAFIGLERIGGVMVYDVTNPYEPSFVQYMNDNRNFSAVANTDAAGDLGPEGIHFISADESPTGVPLIAVANEISGTTTVYELVQAK